MLVKITVTNFHRDLIIIFFFQQSFQAEISELDDELNKESNQEDEPQQKIKMDPGKPAIKVFKVFKLFLYYTIHLIK